MLFIDLAVFLLKIYWVRFVLAYKNIEVLNYRQLVWPFARLFIALTINLAFVDASKGQLINCQRTTFAF